MTRDKREMARRTVALAYVAAVTAFLLALVLARAADGPEGIPGLVVYALAAGFGLEFVGSAWTGRRREAGIAGQRNP